MMFLCVYADEQPMSRVLMIRTIKLKLLRKINDNNDNSNNKNNNDTS